MIFLIRKSYLLCLILFAGVNLVAQNISESDLEKEVLGYIIYGTEMYLVTDAGFIRAGEPEKNDPNKQYEDYYREVYGDSTITNPNLIIGGDDANDVLKYIVPFIDINSANSGFKPFNQVMLLNEFVKVEDNGQLLIMSNIPEILERNQTGTK